MDINRRAFFSGTWLRDVLTIPASAAETEELKPDCTDGYFSSLETCYAFLSEVPMEDLQNEAIAREVAFEGLSKFELARLLFSAGQYRSR